MLKCERLIIYASSRVDAREPNLGSHDHTAIAPTGKQFRDAACLPSIPSSLPQSADGHSDVWTKYRRCQHDDHSQAATTVLRLLFSPSHEAPSSHLILYQSHQILLSTSWFLIFQALLSVEMEEVELELGAQRRKLQAPQILVANFILSGLPLLGVARSYLSSLTTFTMT
jgi:4-amino-4-deoxy-L-arabinose transferase-like glycosyltransferase